MAKETLERRAGARERGAHQRRRDHARASNQQHHILDRRRDRGWAAGEPRDEDLDELGERDRIASHGERDEEPEREQAERDDEAWEEAAGHGRLTGTRRSRRGPRQSRAASTRSICASLSVTW